MLPLVYTQKYFDGEAGGGGGGGGAVRTMKRLDYAYNFDTFFSIGYGSFLRVFTFTKDNQAYLWAGSRLDQTSILRA